MTLSPDDLPRSPTGRIPRWVVEEATGRPVQPAAWREYLLDAPPVRYPVRPTRASRRRRRRRVVRPTFVLALVLSLLAAGLTGIGMSPERGLALAQTLQGWADAVPGLPLLPPASRRSFPVPGFEEAAARLAPTAPSSGTGTGYAFGNTRTAPDGQVVPVTWSPCRPIHYVIDPAGAPPEFAAQVAAVVAEISAASGLVFIDDGSTAEPADLNRSAFQPAVYGDRWAPVLIRFTDAATVPELAGDVAGMGGGSSYVEPTTGIPHYVSGLVFLDTELLTAPPAADGPAYLPVLRHELGHVVGLAHVEDPTQLMHPVNGGRGTFAAGDLTGLALLGQGPCAAGL